MANKGKNILGEEESNDFKAVKGQCAADLWEDTFEELDATVDAFIRFLELRMKSQYAQEIVSFTGAHD